MTTVYDDTVNVTMRGVEDHTGLPHTVNSFQIIGSEVLIELREGPPGDPGVEGVPSWPWIWQGDIATQVALDALAPALTTDDAGFAWRVVSSNQIRYWDGVDFIAFYDAFQAEGRKGAPNRLTTSAVVGATGSSADAQLTGTSPAQHLEITFPRGVTGDTGDAGGPGRIQDASDYDDSVTLGQDMVLGWDTATSKFRPIGCPSWRGPWALSKTQIAGGSNVSTSPKTVATVTVPSQGFAWRPMIQGNYAMQSHVPTLNSGRTDIEIRINSVDGPLVGYGVGFPSANWNNVNLFPRFDSAITDPNSSLVGVIGANQTTTFYMIAKRAFGNANYSMNVDYAQITIYAVAVPPT